MSSDTSLKATLNLDDLNFEHRKWNMWAAYGQSKLADVLFAAELARRFDLNGLTAYSLHPGMVRTNLANSSGLLGLAWNAMKPFLASPQNGARTPLYLCTEPGIENLTGQYFTKENAPSAHLGLDNEYLAKELWHRSEQVVGLPSDGSTPSSVVVTSGFLPSSHG